MKRKNCGKHVYEVPAPFCLNKLYRWVESPQVLTNPICRTKCPVDCRKASSKPVCGSDGQLYANSCELEKMTCGFPLTRYERVTKVRIHLILTVTASCRCR